MAPKKAKKAERFTSEDLHRALFEVPPEPRSVEEMEEGIRRAVESRFARLRSEKSERPVYPARS